MKKNVASGFSRTAPDLETRERLLKAAERLIAERGYKKVTVRDICRAARANVAAVNYHFGDKEGLYRELLQIAIDVVREIERYKVFFKDWHGALPDPAEIVDELRPPTPAGIIDALYSRYAAQFGADRWGDKSPIYTRSVDTIAAIYPAAQFVHIVRDGRDVATSMLHAYATKRFFYYDIYYAARTWRQDVGAARVRGGPWTARPSWSTSTDPAPPAASGGRARRTRLTDGGLEREACPAGPHRVRRARPDALDRRRARA